MIIGICDDQSDARDHLKKYCCKLGCQDILMYPSGEELLHSPDLYGRNQRHRSERTLGAIKSCHVDCILLCPSGTDDRRFWVERPFFFEQAY